MIIKSATFIGSFTRESQAPKTNLPEFAFIGRSNVGKSSLINALSNVKDIAKVSQTPGKTRHINYFLMNEEWYLVDLPGYGYAKASKKDKAQWETMIERYLVVRPTLQCAIVLLDSRHDLQKVDLEFVNWLGERHIPFVIAFTKLDKLKDHHIQDNIDRINDSLLEHWNSLPEQFLTSAKDKRGREELLKFIDRTNQLILPS